METKSNLEIKIKNSKAAGRFASGFEKTVLSAKPVDDGLVFEYAEFDCPGYRPGKMNDGYSILPYGVGAVAPGYKKNVSVRLFGEELIQLASWVKGQTYPIRKELYEMGFRWDGKAKVWRRSEK